MAAALLVRGKLLSKAECRGPRFRGKGVLCSHGHLRAVFYTRGLDRSSISCHRTVPEACGLVPSTEVDADLAAILGPGAAVRHPQKASQDPGGLWPPFAFDTTALSGLTWTITGDAMSSQQVASASNGTHEFIVELYGLSPRISAIEVYSGQDYEFTIRVTTGEDVSIELREGLPRSQVPFVPQQPDLVATYGDTTVLFGAVPDGMAHEVDLSEVVIHAWSEGESAASMRLDWGDYNVTAEDGTWWSIMWLDAGRPGLLSSLDEYRVRTNSTEQFDVRFYDLWSDCWTDRAL